MVGRGRLSYDSTAFFLCRLCGFKNRLLHVDEATKGTALDVLGVLDGHPLWYTNQSDGNTPRKKPWR
jgi:hypothetical protein